MLRILFSLSSFLASFALGVTVASKDNSTFISFDDNGAMQAISNSNHSLPVAATTSLAGCNMTSSSVSFAGPSGVAVRREWACTAPVQPLNVSVVGGFAVAVVETYTPLNVSVGWEASLAVVSAPGCIAQPCTVTCGGDAGDCCHPMACIYDPTVGASRCIPPELICEAGGVVSSMSGGPKGGDGRFTTAIVSGVAGVPHNATYFTTWGRGVVANNGPEPGSAITGGAWRNPLETAPMPETSAVYRLGAWDPHNLPGSDSMTVPMVTLVSVTSDFGVSVLLSPADATLQEVVLNVTATAADFSRKYLRLSTVPTVVRGAIVAHAGCFRGGLAAGVAQYPAFFEAWHPNASEFAGMGGYSWTQNFSDVEYRNAVGFKTNWDLSGTFGPYMGLFLPYAEEWVNLGYGLPKYNVTFDTIRNDYANIVARGFHTLSYFNVAEWGTDITLPPPAGSQASCGLRPTGEEAPCVEGTGASSAFLAKFMPTALLTSGWSVPGGWVDGRIKSWDGCTVLDAGDYSYQMLLVEQAQAHIANLSDTFEGITIDRLDHTSLYNFDADDGMSWVPLSANGSYAPARSLRVSFREVVMAIHEVYHNGDSPRLIWMNCNALCRTDLMFGADGLFSEGSALNAVAWGTLRTPGVLWTYKLAGLSGAALDDYFQQHLVMGVAPMAPIPDNDHSIQPGNTTIEAYYKTYAPMFASVSPCKWRLVPHAVSVVEGVANAFDCSAGVVVVAVLGGSGPLEVTANVLAAQATFAVSVQLVGSATWAPAGNVTSSATGFVTAKVDRARGAACVRLEEVQ